MIAAIYARKSTEQNTADEEKSVTRQIEHARAYAAKRGWTVAEEHIYSDDGISGGEFVKRPGFLRLMTALERQAPFQALLMSEESRLGREAIQTGYALKQIMDAGVRVFFYLEDRERTLDNAMDKVMLSLTNFASEMEREKARQRTRDAMLRKAERGHVAGGLVYGYRNVRLDDHVEREILPHEAAVVQRIFDEVASGRGFFRIADGLNRDGIPAPRCGRGWALSGVRELVFRDLYRGRVVWGKTRWIDRRGTKVKQDRPESEWLVREAPALRIVSEAQWQAAHARLARTRQTYLRRTNGKVWGRPESGIESNFLLTGFLECATCGGGLSANWRSGQRGRRLAYYRCNTRHVRGLHVCDNSMTLVTTALEDALLRTFRDDVLTADVVEAVVTRAVELYRVEPDVYTEKMEQLTREAARLADAIQHLTEAIEAGGPLVSLVAALKDRERQRADILAQIEHVEGLAKAPAWGDRLRGELRARLEEWRGFLGRESAIARQILRKLLIGRLVMTPKVTPEGRFYEVRGQASYGRLLEGVFPVRKAMVPPG